MVRRLDLLPEDILLDTLEWLDFSSLLVCQRVCQRLNSTIRGSAVLQHHLLASQCGFPNDRQDLSITERTSLAQKYEVAWRNFSWGHAEHQELSPFSMISVSHAVGYTRLTVNDVEINVHQLPSTRPGVSDSHWSCTLHVPMEINMFPISQEEVWAVYPPEDLIFGIVYHRALPDGCQGHAYTFAMSTGGPHPLAQGGPWEISIPILPGDCRFRGDYVAFETAGTEFAIFAEVWNWKAGLRALCVPIGSHWHSAFLDEAHFLVVSDPNSINGDPGTLWVIDLKHPALPPARLPLEITAHPCLCAFDLPAMINPTSDDPRTFATYSLSATDDSNSTQPSDRGFTCPTLVVDLSICSLVGPARTISFVVNTRRLLSIAHRESALTSTPRRLPWDEWGPDSCRAMQLQRSHLFTICGARCLPYTISLTGYCSLLDFHTGRVHRALASGPTEDDKWRVVADESTITMSPWFLSPIVTRLPYISIPLNPPREVRELAVLKLKLRDDGIVVTTLPDVHQEEVFHIYMPVYTV